MSTRQPNPRGDKPGPSGAPIKEIGARYRPQILQHLLQLDARDRYLRFGYAAQDSQIEHYVEQLDFERDQLFGIFNRRLELIAMAHLAHAAEAGSGGHAEFGVSVAAHARGRGYGTLLFDRAATHAINRGVNTLFIHALSENEAMLGIARKAGAVIGRHGSESEAHLRLPRASLRTRLGEKLVDQLAHVDYWLKSEAKSWREFVVATSREQRNSSRS